MASYKVHPLPGHPTAPPYSRSSSMGTHSTVIQMPDERAVKREEERILMHADGRFGAEQKDFIYKMPELLPPDHPSRRAGRRKGGRRSCCRLCCCCVGVLCLIFAAIVVILGITAAVLYLVLQPKTPDFTVSDAKITAFNLSTKAGEAANARAGVSVYVNADVTFEVRAENPNKKIGLYYDEVEAELMYEGEGIGAGSIPAFYQGHRNKSILYLRMEGKDVGLTASIGSSLKDTKSNIVLHARTLAHVRIKIASWKSHASTFQIDCYVVMSNPTSPNPHLLYQSCSLKVKNLMKLMI